MADCPLCDMPMVDGPSVDRHHLIPKSKKGKDMELCHLVCHRKIHATFSESELMTFYHTWERLRTHDVIAKYIKWVRKQFKRDPEYIERHRQTNARKRRR